MDDVKNETGMPERFLLAPSYKRLERFGAEEKAGSLTDGPAEEPTNKET
jgi:hypothetical protein